MDHETSEELQALKRIWLVPVEEYKQETKQLIFVLPEYRRQRIATELCQLLFAYAQQQNIQHLYLHTHPFLPAAEDKGISILQLAIKKVVEVSVYS